MPGFLTVTVAIPPEAFNVILICAFSPSPTCSNLYIGTVRYPAPGLVISTLINFPSSKIGVNVAGLTLEILTKSSSECVSIATSYFALIISGCGSLESKLTKLNSSTINSFASTLLTRSTTCLSASMLFLNIDCLGLLRIPYFCLKDNAGSGTGLL